MEFNTDMEEVLDLWQNVSKDPKYISDDTGMSLDKVHEILSELSRRGDITDYEDKIVSFNEMYMDDETRKKLGLDKLDGYQKLHDTYVGDGFTIKLECMIKTSDGIVIYFDLSTEYVSPSTLRLFYMPNEYVYFHGMEENDKDWKEIKSHLENLGKLKEFYTMTNKILSDFLPIDYWKTPKNKTLN